VSLLYFRTDFVNVVCLFVITSIFLFIMRLVTLQHTAASYLAFRY
jgi:hypothetical protein